MIVKANAILLTMMPLVLEIGGLVMELAVGRVE